MTGIIYHDDGKEIGIAIPVNTPLQRGRLQILYIRKHENISILVETAGKTAGPLMLTKEQTRELINWFDQQEFE